jgi:organic hydroperoxide reductase OsmC/OhrA
MAQGKEIGYEVEVRWTGNQGSGTAHYEQYSRDYDIAVSGKAPIRGSSDPAFRGDASRYNPEELLVAALSGCHMLWYLHLCANAGLCVTSYIDKAFGRMRIGRNGGGRFDEVVLRPDITMTSGSDVDRARELHGDAHGKCFVANSVNFPVRCEPRIRLAPAARERTP